MKEQIPYKIYLSEEEMPKKWYNIKADMKEQHEPFLNPATGEAITKDDLRPIFCDELIDQELDTTTRFFDIPKEIQDFYKMYRPSPLVRAYFLEKYLDTPAHIYYKYEGTNTSGSHKLNTAIAQTYYAKKQGVKGLTTETGAGQWGTAMSMACAYFNLPLKVFMVKVSAEQKPYRKAVIQTYGGEVIPSPSDTTEIGRKILEENPGTGGSLGCAISEAIEEAVKNDYKYVLGSVLDHVVLHQSIIGLETKKALEKYDITPDIVIGCAGGGSNLGGLIGIFAGEKIQGKNNIHFIAVEPQSCPSMTRGKYAYDFCDTGKTTPLAKMYTLGSGFIPSPNHAGGLRYHGMSPIVSKLYHDGILDESRTVAQSEVFKAATEFARVEGILPAPESSHAIKVAMDEAIKCKETGEAKNIVFGLTGTGYFDMSAYMQYNEGTIIDPEITDDILQKGFDTLPKIK
ncbi:TrpB-like pyridoxal phosphate-dependent enzyme [Anaerofustis sp. NSJ-163]|uniref:TrpB-like pyridoxal phosphate-dependent enzyme n=1 Tax=Anaerofustis sp. NSJ-163 TaxID=2944391 RepID=UPI00209BC0E8|nr:TrpB-like pyridoxal phosphate-dependent enzyme [Anaerofustis sp. NSJ-163]MCO8193976.1 TrpB-like pyridoxal phosphate-dependent enzyme [Anaerofustis sp. NSJ-163]